MAVIATLALAAWWIESRTGWDSVAGERRLAAVERFSDEASRIAGKPVSIRCDESRDYVGFVQHADGIAIVGGDRAYLTPGDLPRPVPARVPGRDGSGARTGRAIAVLAHEAWHLRGEGDEGRTECFALQSGVELGVRLGLSEERARQLMRQQLTENATRGAGTAEYRVPAECRRRRRARPQAGGLDVFPEDGLGPALARLALAAADLEPAARALERPVPPLHRRAAAQAHLDVRCRPCAEGSRRRGRLRCRGVAPWPRG